MFEEAGSGRVELKEDRVEAVERMITYFYTFDYEDSVRIRPLPEIEDPKPATTAEINAHVYAVADKYDVPALKSLALEKFRAECQDIAAGTTILNEGNIIDASALELRRITYTTFSQLGPYHELHEIVVWIWLLGGQELWEYFSEEQREQLLSDLPSFALALILQSFKGRSAWFDNVTKRVEKFGQSSKWDGCAAKVLAVCGDFADATMNKDSLLKGVL